MLEALVLAAGGSTRMGSPKALLRAPDGRSFIIRIIDALREGGCFKVTVVTGIHHPQILDACRTRFDEQVVRVTQNQDPSRGQLSSMLVGMDAVVQPETTGILMTLVDVPLVRADTVSRLISVWEETRSGIVRPVVQDAHGHPVIFSRSLFDALRAAPLEMGARSVVRQYPHQIANVPVDDPGCLIDVDTQADYASLVSRE